MHDTELHSDVPKKPVGNRRKRSVSLTIDADAIEVFETQATMLGLSLSVYFERAARWYAHDIENRRTERYLPPPKSES